jgi:hypothetical protein
MEKTINHRDTETQRKTKSFLIGKELQSFRAQLQQAIVVPSSSFGGGGAQALAFPSPAKRGRGKQTASPGGSFMALSMNKSELGFSSRKILFFSVSLWLMVFWFLWLEQRFIG